MDKKPVMGHNPLGYRPLADAKFNFIPQTEAGSGAGNSDEENSFPSKKTVSFYLEEDLIEEIRRRAKKDKDSYSHFVSKTLRKVI